MELPYEVRSLVIVLPSNRYYGHHGNLVTKFFLKNWAVGLGSQFLVLENRLVALGIEHPAKETI